MSVNQCTKENATSKGYRWYYQVYYFDENGKQRKYHSKKFATRKEAQVAEANRLRKMRRKEINITDMTFIELYEEFYEYKSDKVKETTLKSYRERINSLEPIHNVKIKDFDINHYLSWRRWMSKRDCAIKTKNGYHKFFKEILNYGTRWHDFNFTQIYNKMEKFVDPNALPKEMEFYTLEEFKQFISYEDEILFKSAFEVLYFCGLRLGELRGLTWDNINFEEMTISVKKNVVTVDGKVYVTTPKSKKSVRTIPLTQTLADDLKILKSNCKKYFGFNNKWYVFGDVKPITQERMRVRKNLLASKSGVKPIRLHDFRHSCASLLINNGANIMIVAKYLGHTKIDETLNTYSHLFKNKMEDIVKIMNTLY